MFGPRNLSFNLDYNGEYGLLAFVVCDYCDFIWTIFKGDFGALIGMTNWTKDQTNLLIAEYERRPCLYNMRDPNYVFRHKRELEINAIAEALRKIKPNVTSSDVKQKMRTLRAQYNKERAAVRNSKWGGMDPNEPYQPKLWCYQSLHFLADSADDAAGTSNIALNRIENSSKSNQSFSKTTPNFEETTLDNLEEYNPSCFKRKKTIKDFSLRKQSKRLHKSKSEKNAVLQRALCLIERCTDDCQIFADFIASRLRKLNDVKREELQRSIQLQILEAEAEDSIASNHNETQASSVPMFRNFSDVSHN